MINMLPSNNAYDKNQQVKNVKYKEFLLLKFWWSLSQHRTGRNDSNFHVFESIVFPHYLSSYQIESYNYFLIIHNRDSRCFLENLCLPVQTWVFECICGYNGTCLVLHVEFLILVVDLYLILPLESGVTVFLENLESRLTFYYLFFGPKCFIYTVKSQQPECTLSNCRKTFICSWKIKAIIYSNRK